MNIAIAFISVNLMLCCQGTINCYKFSRFFALDFGF